MLPKINPTKTFAWSKLMEHYLTHSNSNVSEFFKSDPERFKKLSFTFDDFLFDFSKNIVTDKTLDLLVELADECQLKEAISAMFNGENINETENRAVLHTALRSFSDKQIYIDNQDITKLISYERNKVKFFCDQVHNHDFLGATGKPIKYIVNIGIGGSDLGSSMVTEALRPYWKKGIKPYFISNIDGTNLAEVIKEINFEETLFIVASKTFSTQETMTNAFTIRKLFLERFNDETYIQKHFIAVTSNKQKANEFGILNENIFEIWDWVCGRFSLWGSMGISIALTIGYDHFEELLKGANAADKHFENEDFEKNIPVILGLISIWYINFFNVKSEAVLAYDHYLHKFKSYLQQGLMESNGKNVDREGNPIDYQTGTVVWGETGTNGQHSFYQLIHQGTQLIPCDFIAPVNSHNPLDGHHAKLLSNFLAQTEALMKGKTRKEVTESFPEGKEINYKVFKGNIPTNSILIKKITPYNLGSLIAFYEHKIFVQGIIWNIFSFDQWGVELGKELSHDKLKSLTKGISPECFDASTNGLISKCLNWLEN